MTQMLKPSDKDIKTMVINTLKDLVKNVLSIYV